MELWNLSTDMLTQQNFCKQKIKENVDKLKRLADKCGKLNSSLCKVVAESHRMLDNPFLASQAHLMDTMTSLNYGSISGPQSTPTRSMLRLCRSSLRLRTRFA